MLTQEYGTAGNIKSRVNRLSVLAAITSTQQRLKLYSRVPDNGLVVYCGTILTDEGKEKKVNFSFEPFKPINTSLYLCDNKFHTEALAELLEADARFGFIIMDGNGTLFGAVSGNTRTVLQSSRWTCRRSTGVVVSPHCVSPVCVKRRATITCARWPSWPRSTISRTTR